MILNYDKIDNLVISAEARLGKFGFNIVVSFGLLILAAIYVRPECHYAGAGILFEQLANNPFDFSKDNMLAFRILTPLLSYLVGLKGKLFMITNAMIAVIFIGMVYRHFRTNSPRAADAFFAAAIMTFSSVVLVLMWNSGWCDILSYLAIFAMWKWRKNIWLFTLFFAVGLFNHENIMFLLPWLVAVRLAKVDFKPKNVLVTLLSVGVVIALFMVFRNWVSAQRTVGLSLSFYMQPLLDDPIYFMRRPVQFYGLGLFSVFKILWIIPVVGCYLSWKEGLRRKSILMAMPVALASCQLVIAFDTTRMFTLGFMSMVLALEYFFKTNTSWFRKWLPGLLVANLFVPQLYTAADIIQTMRSTPMNLLRMWVDDKPWWP